MNDTAENPEEAGNETFDVDSLKTDNDEETEEEEPSDEDSAEDAKQDLGSEEGEAADEEERDEGSVEPPIAPEVDELVSNNDSFALANMVIDLREKLSRRQVQLTRAKNNISKLQQQLRGNR